MIELKAILTAEFASQDSMRRLTIANTYDRITGTAPQGADLPREGVAIKIDSLHVVYMLMASISDGTDHTAEMRIVHEDGAPAIDPLVMPLQFQLNPGGRPMRYQGIVNLVGLTLRAPGDYSIKLFVDGREIGETPLYLELKVARG